MTTKNIFRCNHLPCALGLALLGLLTGCPATPPPASTAAAPAPAPQIVAQPSVVVQPQVVVQDEPVDAAGFIYYPNYEVYYDPVGRVYWHNDGGRWSNGPAPYGVSAEVLLASPSAHMNFHDSPEMHHAQVVQQYPHDWKPSDQPYSGRDRRGH